MSRPSSSGRVYGGGQPIPLYLETSTGSRPPSRPTSPRAGQQQPVVQQSRVGFGSLSSRTSGQRADFSSGGNTTHTGKGTTPGGHATPAGGSYAGYGSASPVDTSLGFSRFARAVGGAILYPLTAATAASQPVAPPVATGGAATYDPHMSNFPMLPRFRCVVGTDGQLQPIPFGVDSDEADEGAPATPTSAAHRKQTRIPGVNGFHHVDTMHAFGRTQQSLSSMLNSPAFASDEVEPPPLYVPPLPSIYNEPIAAVKETIAQYSKKSVIAGEYLVFRAHHGTYQKPINAHGHETSTASAEKHAMRQYAACLKLVPERYFAQDFSVAQEALMFYEAQLAAAAAEAEEEDAAAAKQQAESGHGHGNGNGNGALAIPSSSQQVVVKSPSSSSASSFYSSFGDPNASLTSASSSSSSSSHGGRTQRAGSTSSASVNNSTYFQAAWAATHAPSQTKEAADAIGIVPGVVGAVLVTPAKAAASLYKLFNKVTSGGGSGGRSPTSLVAQSHQRTMPFSTAAHLRAGGKRGAGGPSAASQYESASPATAEDLNALQLQQRLASYLDLVELTLMQMVGSKSKAFFDSLVNIQRLNREVQEALHLAERIRANMRLLEERLVTGSLAVVKQERALRNAIQLQTMVDIIASIAKTQPTIKLLLSTSEFGQAIELIHSTLALLKSHEFKRIKCLNQMELKLRENLKLIDMLMSAEFIALAIPDVSTTTSGASGGSTAASGGSMSPDDSSPTSLHPATSGAHPPLTTAEGKSALKAACALSEDSRERLFLLSQTLHSFGTLLPTLLKYQAEVKEQLKDELEQEWKEMTQRYAPLSALPPTQPTLAHSNSLDFTGHSRSSSVASSGSPAPSSSGGSGGSTAAGAATTPSNIAMPVNLAQPMPSIPAAAPIVAATSSSSGAGGFMSFIPNALKRSIVVAPAAPVAPPMESAPTTSGGSGGGFDFSGTGSVFTTVPGTSSAFAAVSPPVPSVTPSSASLAADPSVLDAAGQSLVAGLTHAQFLAVQARLHTRLARVIYRAMSVRDVVLEAISAAIAATPNSSASSASASDVSVSLPRLRQEFRDLFKSLLALPSGCTRAAADADSIGIVESRCVSLLEPRLQAHTRLDLYSLKAVFESTMDWVREMEEVGQNAGGGGEDAHPTESKPASKFVCLELRKVTLQHEKSFLSALHSKLVNELTSAMERDSWERIDVPRVYQELIDSSWTRRPEGLKYGNSATAQRRSTGGGGGGKEHRDRAGGVEELEELTTAATYLFIETTTENGGSNPSGAANGDPATTGNPSASSSSSSTSFARYPVTSSTLALLNLLSFYCDCSLQLKGVSSDILKSLVQLLTLFTSRSMQLILGAGAVQVNPEVKVITSKHLAITAQCLSLVTTQLPPIRQLLKASFPEKHHAQLHRDIERVRADFGDHLKELLCKLDAMAQEVCESTTKGAVQWIKREEDILAMQKSRAAAVASGGGAAVLQNSTVNDLPTLFKLSSRLLAQTEALYNVVAEFLQPNQRHEVMGRIAKGYAEKFARYFNSPSGVVASALQADTSRVKLAKRMEATLDKFKLWLAPTEFADMEAQLRVFLSPSAAPTPAPTMAAAPVVVAPTPSTPTPTTVEAAPTPATVATEAILPAAGEVVASVPPVDVAAPKAVPPAAPSVFEVGEGASSPSELP